MTRIYEQDVIDLQGPFNDAESKIKVVGSVRTQELTGYTGNRVIEMEVCLLDHNDPNIRVTQWMRVQCAVSQGACPVDEPKRLDGPWLRWILWHSFTPSRHNEVIIGDSSHLQRLASGMPPRRDHKPPTLPVDGAPAPYTLQVPASWKPRGRE